MATSGHFFGVIKVYYPLKGFGFIVREKGKDVFFFRRSVVDETALIEGASVRFQLENDPKGARAVNIERSG